MDRLNIRTKNRKFETAKDLYGIFFEDINRAGDGGIYPEMIRNRCFEDSLLPEGYTQRADGVNVPDGKMNSMAEKDFLAG